MDIVDMNRYVARCIYLPIRTEFSILACRSRRLSVVSDFILGQVFDLQSISNFALTSATPLFN